MTSDTAKFLSSSLTLFWYPFLGPCYIGAKCILKYATMVKLVIPWLSETEVAVNPPIMRADATGRYCNFYS